MAKIEKVQKAGWKKRLAKINEIITRLNPLMDIRVNKGANVTKPDVQYSDNTVVILIKDYDPELDAIRARLDALESP